MRPEIRELYPKLFGATPFEMEGWFFLYTSKQ